jgi:hypothetical protein
LDGLLQNLFNAKETSLYMNEPSSDALFHCSFFHSRLLFQIPSICHFEVPSHLVPEKVEGAAPNQLESVSVV